ncbi:hypothetical protein PLEOSDRAFT_1110747 [Pleurotus ostreatus PC15]|uniref:Uncharacterized protein n=1 Tax=Pleurotus ostreatus (strain PC15) TaxID=1137138 RepID=A0A067PDB1_PLEO1|nr:hypothetical protein PLEOSDRAFT_1110747 [Pleurotus ostreatus PC15]
MGTVNSHSLTWSRRQILPQLRLFADLLPDLPYLECLAIRGIWEIPVLFRGIIPFPLSSPALLRAVRCARRAFGKLRALRLEYECRIHVYWRSVEELPRGFTQEYVAGLARLIRSWHAAPWVCCEDFEFVRELAPGKRSTCIWKWSLTLPLEALDEGADSREGEDAEEDCDLPHDGSLCDRRGPRAVSLVDLPNILYDDEFCQDEEDF